MKIMSETFNRLRRSRIEIRENREPTTVPVIANPKNRIAGDGLPETMSRTCVIPLTTVPVSR